MSTARLRERVDSLRDAVERVAKRAKATDAVAGGPLLAGLLARGPSHESFVREALDHMVQPFHNDVGVADRPLDSGQALIAAAWVGAFAHRTRKTVLALAVCRTVHDFWAQVKYAHNAERVGAARRRMLPETTHDEAIHVPRSFPAGRVCAFALPELPSTSADLTRALRGMEARGHIRVLFDWDLRHAAAPVAVALVQQAGWEAHYDGECSYFATEGGVLVGYVRRHEELLPLVVLQYSVS